MRERPIPFSPPMVRAIRRKVNPKTVTRRIVKHVPADTKSIRWVENHATVPNGLYTGWVIECGAPFLLPRTCPYGVPGDKLWVRESYRFGAEWDDTKPSEVPPTGLDRGDVYYEADGLMTRPEDNGWGKLRPGMFMPRWASRITLELVSVRAERVQDITEADAIAEGVETHAQKYGLPEAKLHGITPWYRYDDKPCAAVSAVESYRTLWESINGAGSWAANPYVWRLEFTPC